jgi:hypothetical protein
MVVENGGRTRTNYIASCLLPQLDAYQKQNAVPTYPKDTLWSIHGKEETGALF